MTESEAPSAAISLEDLVALNEELAALVRAGVPLNVGLGSSRGTSRRLRQITARLREELERGGSLPDALKLCGAGLPASYLAVIEAGVKSSRLSDSLAAASAFARNLLEMQRRLRSALIYPAIVISVAYLFLVLFCVSVWPEMSNMLADVQPTPTWGRRLLGVLSGSVLFWGPILPLIGLAFAAWIGLIPLPFSARPAAVLNRLRWLPWLGRIVGDAQRASFCQLLGILVERNVPLPDALELSAAATADRQMINQCRDVAGSLRRGVPLNEALAGTHKLPAFTRWMLTAGQAQGELASVLGTLADIYHRRARSRTELFQISAPLVLTAGIGGACVAGYALLVFTPMRNLFLDLSASGIAP